MALGSLQFILDDLRALILRIEALEAGAPPPDPPPPPPDPLPIGVLRYSGSQDHANAAALDGATLDEAVSYWVWLGVDDPDHVSVIDEVDFELDDVAVNTEPDPNDIGEWWYKGSTGGIGTTVAHDATSSFVSNSSLTSATWSHTCSGNDRCLVVIARNNDNTIDSITYGGQHLTREERISSDIDHKLELWRLLNPPSGVNDIVVTYAGAVNRHNHSAHSYTGVGAIGASTVKTSSSGLVGEPDVDITTTADGSMIVGGFNQLLAPFPRVRATTFSEETANTTTHDVDMTGVQAGDHAILFAFYDMEAAPAPQVSGMPSGWVQIVEGGNSAGAGMFYEIWEKVACTGSEVSFTYTLDQSQKSQNRVFLISESHPTQPTAAGSQGSGGGADAGTTPNPPSITASWGTAANLAIAFYEAEAPRGYTLAYPTGFPQNNYTSVTTTSTDESSIAYGVATSRVNSATSDPPPFTKSSTDLWVARALMVRPTATAADSPTYTPDAGTVERYDALSGSGSGQFSGATGEKAVAVAGAATLGWVRSPAPDSTWQWTAAAIELQAIPGGAVSHVGTEFADGSFTIEAIATLTVGGPSTFTASFTVDPEPPPVVIEDFPIGAIHVNNNTELANAVAANPAGTIFALHGQYSGQLPVKNGNQYWGDPDPALRTRFVGPGPTVIGGHFYKGNNSGVLLKHLTITRYGPDVSNHDGSVIQAHTGVSAPTWTLDDVEISHSRQNLLRWTDGWTVRNSYFHHAGAFGMCGGGGGALKLCEDTLVTHCGITHDGITAISSSDRGMSKFAITKNVTFRRLEVHTCYMGLWFDIANETMVIEDYYGHDIERVGLDIEVSYGPCTILRPRLINVGTRPDGGELANNWALPPAILITLTPDVTITDMFVSGADQGAISHQWAHPQISNNPPYAPIDRSRLGCENVIFNGGIVTNITNFTPARATNGTNSYSAGQTGGQQPGVRPTRNVHWNNVAFDANAKFVSSLHIT